MISFRHVAKAFGGKAVLRDVNLEIERGEAMFIVGTSGVGKSVTIKHLVGLLRIDAGEIWFDGLRLDTLTEAEFYPVRRRIAMVFQHATLFDSMTLTDNVALPLRKHRQMRSKDAREAALEFLDRVYLREFADHYPATLSDGLRKRAAIARALTMEPEVILFDEPTTGLDPVSARRIDALITELCSDGKMTAIVVSHDLESIRTVADRVALLYQGRIHVCASPATLRQSPDPVIQQFLGGHATGPMETPGF